MSKTIRYSSLDELLCNFSEVKEELSEELRNSDISWGSEQQLTLADASYVHQVIEEYLAQAFVDAEEAKNEKKLAKYSEYIATIKRIDGGLTQYYCMEE